MRCYAMCTAFCLKIKDFRAEVNKYGIVFPTVLAMVRFLASRLIRISHATSRVAGGHRSVKRNQHKKLNEK